MGDVNGYGVGGCSWLGGAGLGAADVPAGVAASLCYDGPRAILQRHRLRYASMQLSSANFFRTVENTVLRQGKYCQSSDSS